MTINVIVGSLDQHQTVLTKTRNDSFVYLPSWMSVQNDLTLKAPRKKMHLKMSSAEVVCCKQSPNITDKLSIVATSVDPDQTAPIGAV